MRRLTQLREVTTPPKFDDAVRDIQPRLRRTLVAALGVDAGLEAAADALAYGWEHWERVGARENPGGYLYTVGLRRARGRRSRPVRLPAPDAGSLPWTERALPAALESLPTRQRTALLLVHSFGYSLAEAARLMDVSKATAQTHVERALDRLRTEMGVQ